MARECPFSLLNDEELILETRPHPLAMTGLMLFWLFIMALGVLFIIYYPWLSQELAGSIKYDFPGKDFIVDNTYNAIWVVALLVPLLVMAIFKINFRYVLTLIALIIISIVLRWKVEPLMDLDAGRHSHLENYLLILAGALGVFGVEVFRRGHRYYLTNKRIVAYFGNIKTSERSTLYSKIDDLIVQVSLLGKLFNFGTVIPVTSTGLGMGQDMAIAGAGAGAGKMGAGAALFAAGGKAKNVPRELSIYVLYRIPDPDEARNLVMQEMQDRE